MDSIASFIIIETGGQTDHVMQ